MIEACLFDLDGTLLDTLDSIRMYVNLLFDERKLKPLDKESVRRFVGDGARVLIRRCLAYAGVPEAELEDLTAELTPIYVNMYNSDPFPLTKPYTGIVEALGKLRSRGLKLAVISNKPHDTVAQLCDSLLPGVFDIVRGAKDGVPLKPNPFVSLQICEALGVKPENTAYFGDTGVDIKTAKAYGAGKTVGVLWGFRGRDELSSFGADVLIDDAAKIAECLGID